MEIGVHPIEHWWIKHDGFTRIVKIASYVGTPMKALSSFESDVLLEAAYADGKLIGFKGEDRSSFIPVSAFISNIPLP